MVTTRKAAAATAAAASSSKPATRTTASAKGSDDPTRNQVRPNKVNKNKSTRRGKGRAPRYRRERTRFLWIPVADPEDIVQEPSLSVENFAATQRFLDAYPMFTEENITMIKQRLGHGFARRIINRRREQIVRDRRYVHQGVATMQNLRHCFNRYVDFRSWAWLESQLEMLEDEGSDSSDSSDERSPPAKNTRHAVQARKREADPEPEAAEELHELLQQDRNIPCTIYLHWTFEPGPKTSHIYSAVSAQAALRSNPFRCFPSQLEAAFESFKIGDIQVLNRIAATSPRHYAYRPRTCLTHAVSPHNMSTCPLAGEDQIIMKRTHSSGGDDVELVDGDRAEPKHRTKRGAQVRWFGQEVMPSFQAFGEFRVFTVAKPNQHSQRGRRGNVLHTLITDWPESDHPEEMYARAVSDYDFQSEHVRPLGKTDLHDFALYVYERFRGLNDWREHYESLEIGVRLDVGIGVDNGVRRFYVNEITRFYGADYFSQATLGEPKMEIAYGLAEAIDAYFS